MTSPHRLRWHSTTSPASARIHLRGFECVIRNHIDRPGSHEDAGRTVSQWHYAAVRELLSFRPLLITHERTDDRATTSTARQGTRILALILHDLRHGRWAFRCAALVEGRHITILQHGIAIHSGVVGQTCRIVAEATDLPASIRTTPFGAVSITVRKCRRRKPHRYTATTVPTTVATATTTTGRTTAFRHETSPRAHCDL